MRWLLWTEGIQKLFIRIMQEWPKGFSKDVTPLQKHSTGWWVQGSIIGNTQHLHEFMVHWTMNLTVVSVSHNPVLLYSLSPGEVPVCPCTVWNLTVVPREGRVPKPWWCPSGAYSAGLQYPRVVMQGSLHLDFKGLPYSFGPCRESLWRGELQNVSMGIVPEQLWCKTLSRESQQEKSVEDI
jgi:hypothetical protein